MENKAKFIKEIYNNKKYCQSDFIRIWIYEYHGSQYVIYPDAAHLSGYSLSEQHKEAQENIDYKPLNDSILEQPSEQALNDFFDFLNEWDGTEEQLNAYGANKKKKKEENNNENT